MQKNPQIAKLLAQQPIPDEIWEHPEELWVEPAHTGGDEHPSKGWSLIQTILFSRRLLEVPGNIDLVTPEHAETKDTLLHWAVRWELTQETLLLLSKGADPHRKNKAGETPASLAATSKDPSLKLVMEKSLAKIQRERARRALRPSAENIEL